MEIPPKTPADDVFIKVPPAAQSHFALRSRAVDTGPQDDPNPEVVLGTLIVEGRTGGWPCNQRSPESTCERLWSPDANGRQASQRNNHGQAHDFFSESRRWKHVFIDGKMYDEGRIDTEVKLGDIEEWTGERHVFHIHQLDFLVTMMNGQALDYEGLRDVIDVPEASNGVPGEVKLIIPFTNPVIVGKFVYHCHILEHEDKGMMANIVVLPP